MSPALPDRRDGDSLKWNHWRGQDVIPLWVADMDWPAAPAVLAALRARLDHGIFGYPDRPTDLEQVAVQMLASRHGWRIEASALCWLPSLVAGIELCCRAFATLHRRVLTTTPIYPPFLHAPGHQGAALVRWPLVRQDGRWQHDLTALRGHLASGIDVVLLCSPHNPTGRVFTRDELAALADVLADSDAIVVSDEAWADVVLDGVHVPLAVAAPQLAPRLVTLISPAKAFNLPGLRLGAAVVTDADLRRRLEAAGHGVAGEQNLFGLVAARAAWAEGWAWHADILDRIRANRDRAVAAVRALGLACDLPESTYLLWVDCSTLDVADVAEFFVRAGVGVMPGAWFGAPDHVRLNLACDPALLATALERMAAAVRGAARR
jgi:cystathionine beta-lyase